MTVPRSKLAPRYYAHQVELLPERPLHPISDRPLPAHWPQGPHDTEAQTLVSQLREGEHDHAELSHRMDRPHL